MYTLTDIQNELCKASVTHSSHMWLHWIISVRKQRMALYKLKWSVNQFHAMKFMWEGGWEKSQRKEEPPPPQPHPPPQKATTTTNYNCYYAHNQSWCDTKWLLIESRYIWYICLYWNTILAQNDWSSWLSRCQSENVSRVLVLSVSKAHTSMTLCDWGVCSQKDGLLLNVHRNHRFIRDGSPGHPPRLSHSPWALKDGADKLPLFWRWQRLWSGVSDSVLLHFFLLRLCYWPDFPFLFYKDIYVPVTFKCTQELVLVTFCSHGALTNGQNITVSHV